MAAKYRSMGQRCNSLALVMLIALAPCFAQGQVQNGMLYSTGNSLYTTDIFELSNGSFVVYKHPYSSMEPSGLLKFNASGQILASYDRTDTYITSVHQIGSGFILLTTDSLNWQGSRRAIILDNNLNLIRSLVPIYAQFPKSFFSYPQPILFQGKIGYFTNFFNNLTDSPAYGFLSFSTNLDTLAAHEFTFSSDSIVLGGVTSWNNSIFYAISGSEGVNTPGIGGSTTSVLRMFNDSLQQLYRRNIFVPSTIPGFPRYAGSNGMTSLAINNHSLYGSSNYTSVSPNNFFDEQESFAVYQFDHQLNIKRVYHALANTGRKAENPYASSGTTLDISGKFLYVLGTNATPRPLFFNDQDRTGALTILKFDTALNLIWRTEIEIPKTFIEAGSMVATADGGVLVAANRIDSTPNPNIRNLFVVKLDSAGRHSVSVAELDAQTKVTVYPNPVVDQFTLHYSQGQYENLLLYNQNGQLVYRQPLDASTNLHTVPIGHLPGGMYFYTLEGQGKPLRGKVVKRLFV